MASRKQRIESFKKSLNGTGFSPRRSMQDLADMLYDFTEKPKSKSKKKKSDDSKSESTGKQ